LVADWQYASKSYGSATADSTAESMSLLFMLEDQSVFGYNRFTITDSDLFKSIPVQPGGNGREIKLNQSNQRTGQQNRESLYQLEVEVCFNSYVCNWPDYCSQHGGCDYVNCISSTNPCYLVASICFYYYYDIDAEQWSTGSGGGPEGGGGGGGWNNWDPPQCPGPTGGRLSQYQDCDPGWTPPGIIVPIEVDPCADAQAGAAKATTLAQNSVYLAAKSNIQTASSDNLEHSVTFGKDASENITSSSMTTGTANSGTINTNWPGAFADLHNHPGNSPPSPGDFYGLITVNQNHSGYDTRFVVTADGSVYALLIIDPAAATTFVTNYPSQQVPGYSPEFPTAIIDEINEMKGFYGATDEMAMAFILEKYNTGVALLKQNSNGSFKRLRTTETIDPNNGTKTYTANNCP